MKNELSILCRDLQEADNNSDASLEYWKFPKLKYDRFVCVVRNIMKEGLIREDCLCHNPPIRIIESYTNTFLDKLNEYYQQNQDFCWQVHDQHFHVALDEYIKCPQTCLTEVSEFLEKVQKKMFSC